MILICRPRGRGNWKTVEITINRAADLFTVKRGDTFHLGTLVLRVVEIRV